MRAAKQKPWHFSHPFVKRPILLSISQSDGSKVARVPSPWVYVKSLAWVRPLLLLICLYLCGLLLLWALARSFPPLASLSGSPPAAATKPPRLSLPRSFAELKEARASLALVAEAFPVRLLLLLTGAQIFLQSFMIPGSVALNVLGGSLFSFPVALAYSTVSSTCGAAANYCLVHALLKDAVWTLFPVRVATFARELRRHQAHLLHYMLFLRVTPIFPAWFINLAAPIVEVPLLSVFMPATAVGHQPINLITIQAGRALYRMESLRDLYSFKNVLFMMAVGALALVHPVARRLQLRKRGGGEFEAAPDGRLLPVSVPAAQLREL